MKTYIYGLLALFFVGITVPNHAMNEHEKPQQINLPFPIIKYIGREAFWHCTSIAEFKKALNNFTLVNKNFLQVSQKIQTILTNKNIDAATKYKEFLKHIGFNNQDILLIAAKIGHLGLFKHYFNSETSPLITGEDNTGTYKSLQEILEAIRDHEGNTIAHIAAKNGHKELWNHLLSNHSERIIDLEGSRQLYSGIHWLSQNNINTLLDESNKYVNGLNNNAGHQPFDYAYKSFGKKANANVIKIKFQLFPPIFKFAAYPPLLRRGTPLFMAIQCKANNEILQELIDHGADLNATYACDKQNVVDVLQFCILRNDMETFNYLSIHGCSVEKKYEHNESLLFWLGQLIAYGLYQDDFNFFGLLYDKLSTTLNDQSTKDGQTLLHRAINGSNKHFIKKLIELKASCSLQDHQGNTPLHLGLLRKDIPVDEEFCTLAQSLMNQEVISAKNHKGKTPSDLIIERLKIITLNQEAERIFLENLFTYIRENYNIEHEVENFKNNSDDDNSNDSATGDNYFNPVQENKNPNLFESIENKISSLFSPLGNLLDKYLGKK